MKHMKTTLAIFFFLLQTSISLSLLDWEQYWSFWSEDDHPVYNAERFLNGNITDD